MHLTTLSGRRVDISLFSQRPNGQVVDIYYRHNTRVGSACSEEDATVLLPYLEAGNSGEGPFTAVYCAEANRWCLELAEFPIAYVPTAADSEAMIGYLNRNL